jgi:hypothetical protein
MEAADHPLPRDHLPDQDRLDDKLQGVRHFGRVLNHLIPAASTDWSHNARPLGASVVCTPRWGVVIASFGPLNGVLSRTGSRNKLVRQGGR